MNQIRLIDYATGMIMRLSSRMIHDPRVPYNFVFLNQLQGDQIINNYICLIQNVSSMYNIFWIRYRNRYINTYILA